MTAMRAIHRIRMVLMMSLFLLCIVMSVNGFAASGDITTVAGGENSGQALQTNLAHPRAIHVTPAGVVYIADTANHRIRKINANGVVTTVAGNGRPGFAGDGGAATVASLNYPKGVAVDGLGNIYIADTDNHRIRKVDTSGIITTVAGNGTPGPVYCGEYCPLDGTSVSIPYPETVSIDGSGNIRIVDYAHIWSLSPTGTMLNVIVASGYCGSATCGGNPVPVVWFPTDFLDAYIDNAGTVFVVRTISDYATELTKYNATTGQLVPVKQMKGLAHINGDALGNLYFADAESHQVFKIDPSGNMTVFAGSGEGGMDGDGGPAVAAKLDQPANVFADAYGYVYIADARNNRIRRVDPNGDIWTFAGNVDPAFAGDGAQAAQARLNNPRGIFVDAAGNVFIADAANHRVRKMDVQGVITTVAGNGIPGFSGDNGPATQAGLYYPVGVIADSFGNLYIADAFNDRIRKVDTAGIITTIAGSDENGYLGDGGPATLAALNFPSGLIMDSAGNIFIADTFNNVIRKIDTGGTIHTYASVMSPRSIAMDPAGNLYAATGINGIQKIDPTGTVTALPSCSDATGVSFDVAGIMYMACRLGHTIKGATPGVAPGLVAGTGTEGFSGDGGPALAATFASPSSVFVDVSGAVYIADSGNNRVRRIEPGLKILPWVTISSPMSGVSNIKTPLLTYTVSNGTVVVKVDGVVVNKVSGNNLDPLADGQHTIRVEATDANGTGFAERTFTVDTIAPSVSILSPHTGFTNSNPPILTYTVSDGTVVVHVDNSYIVFKNSGDTLDGLSEGAHSITVEATDAAGNTGSATVSFTIDTIPPSVASTSKITAGSNSTATIKSDGTLWAWGFNGSGQLGNGTTVDKISPIQISKENAWTAVDTKGSHTIALKSDGTLWAWGDNGIGQVGDGTNIRRITPVQIGTDSDWVAISAGYNHSVALKSDGTLWAWGYNGSGQLGNGTTYTSYFPVQVGTSKSWVAVDAGFDHTIALRSDSTLWAWGDNSYGQVGNGTTTMTLTPVQIGTDHNWASIAGGGWHSLAIKSDGSLWAWGADFYYQLGDGSYIAKSRPVRIGSDTSWASIAAGGWHSLALKRDGSLWTWGGNQYGQLGDVAIVPPYSKVYPGKIGTDVDWVSIAGGQHYSMALKSDGTLWATGKNSSGQLGDGTNIDKTSFEQIGSAGKISINKGANSTATMNVTLDLLATDANGVAGMQFSNDGSAWSVPEPYATTKAWTLASGDGLKTVFVKFKDNAGNWSNAYSASITLDTTAPVVTLVSPSAGFTNNKTPLLTYTVSDGTVVVKVDGAAVSKVSGDTLAVLADGPHNIRVESTDAAGNTGFAEVTFTVDTIAPTVAITSPAPGSTHDNAPVLTYTVSDGTVTVKVDGVVIPRVSGDKLTALTDGTHTVRVESTDAAGNIGFAEITFIVDTVAPTVSIASPVAGITNNNKPLLTYTASDGVVVVKVDGVIVSKTSGNTLDTLPDGQHTVRVEAVDVAGNTGFAEVTFVVDTISPIVSITSPAPGLTKNNRPLLTYTVSDGTVVVKVDGIIVSKVSGNTLDPLSDGPHVVRVESTDAAGNVSFAEAAFTVDTVPPMLGINPVTTPTKINNQIISGNRESGANVGVLVNTSATVGSVSYPSAITWSCPVSGLAETMNTIIVTATDAAGNTAVATSSITYDGTAPAVTVTSPAAVPTNDNTPLLTYTVSDGTVIVKVDGAVVSKVSGDSLNTLSDGSHTVQVESTDAAGNTGFATVTFTVDTVPPTISINPVVSPTRNTTQTVTGTRESAATVTVQVNTSATVGSVSYPTATTWSCTIFNMLRGVHAITATAKDAAGNTANATRSITVK